MAAHHPASAEPDSGTDSVTSTPRSIHKNPDNQPPPPRIRMMCSFGGKILPRPHDNQLRYVGGDTRIVAVSRSTTFSSLVSKLSKLTGAVPGEFSVKYQLPNEDLDALITVSTDEDVENLMEEWDRFTSSSTSNKTARLRLFLFPNAATADERDSRASSISSLLDGSTKRESWFLDALNGGRADLERGRSEASSIVSEVPDYLFGLDNSEDPNIQMRMMESRLKNRRAVLTEDIPGSDPGSPMVTAPSPFCSSSSAPACVPTTPNLNLPPVKTKAPEVLSEVLSEPGSAGEVRAVPVQAPPPPQVASGYPGVPPVWAHPGHGHHQHQGAPTPSPYSGHAPVQAIPVYYVTAPGPGQGPVQQVPGQFVQQYQMPPGQVPIGYHQAVSVPGTGQMYTGPVRPSMATPEQYHHDMQGRVVGGGGGPNQPVYYGIRGGGGGYPGYPGMVMGGAGEEVQGTGPDGSRAGPV